MEQKSTLEFDLWYRRSIIDRLTRLISSFKPTGVEPVGRLLEAVYLITEKRLVRTSRPFSMVIM